MDRNQLRARRKARKSNSAKERAKNSANDASMKAAAEAQAVSAEMKSAEEAISLREKSLAEVELLRKTLQDAMNEVDSSNQYVLVSSALKALMAHELFGGDSTGRSGNVSGIPELVQRAIVLITKLEHMNLLKESVARLNQVAIAEIKSFATPMQEIEDTMRATFLLLGEDQKNLESWKGIKVAIGRTGKRSLKRRIAGFMLSSIQDSNNSVADAKRIIAKVDVARMTEISVGTATFYAWSKGVLDELE